VIDGGDDISGDDIAEETDELLERAFPGRKGDVDAVSWQVSEETEYRLYFGRLSRHWGIASWGLIRLRRGTVVDQAMYEDRPPAFTRDGLATWLVGSGVDAGAALQLTDLAIEARGDLFPGEQPPGTEPQRLTDDE
jgi:hypothetical protein